MRIARFSVDGAGPRFGLVELAGDGGKYPETVAEIAGDPLAGDVALSGRRWELAKVRLLAPVADPGKILCMGMNWAQHAAELGAGVPTTPVVFLKPATSVVGPGDAVVYPPETAELHYEGELAIVIGERSRRVPRDRAAGIIAGYTCANDITARDLQREESQWTRAKGFDTFCPLGPWLVTDLSLEQASRLGVRTLVDGEVKQDDTTAHMVRGIAEIIEFISGFTTLYPGDIILSGTPSGIGPLQPGQQVSVEIEGNGTLTNPVVAESAQG